jgi:hypothetical protein
MQDGNPGPCCPVHIAQDTQAVSLQDPPTLASFLLAICLSGPGPDAHGVVVVVPSFQVLHGRGEGMIEVHCHRTLSQRFSIHRSLQALPPDEIY